MRIDPGRAALTVCAALALAGTAGCGTEASSAAPAKTALAWRGKTIKGKPISSADLKGRVVLMNFFNNY